MPDFNEIMGLLAKADEELGKLREENSELREYLLDAIAKGTRTCVLNFLLLLAIWFFLGIHCAT